MGLIKYIFMLVIMLWHVFVFAHGYSLEEQVKIDSLKTIVNSTAHDTIKVKAYKAWDEIIYVEESGLDLILNLLIDSICCHNLSKNLSSETKSFFLSHSSNSLNNLGLVYEKQGKTQKAFEYLHKSLKIEEEIGDRNGIANSLFNIGMTYKNQREIPKALEYYHKSLKIYKEIGDKNGIAISLNDIGRIYKNLGESSKALEYYDKSMKIKEELGDKLGIATSLNNIGAIYDDQGEIQNALECYHKSLKIREEIGNKLGIATCLNNLGAIYIGQGATQNAMEYYHKSLQIRKEIGDKSGIAVSLNNIGLVYYDQGETLKALEYFYNSLKTHEEIRDKKGIAYSLNNIGLIYHNQGEIKKALEYFHNCLKIHEEIGDKKGIATGLNNIGSIYDDHGKTQKALEYFHKCLNIQEEIGNKNGIAISLNNIAHIYNAQGESKKALEFLHKSMKIKEEIGDKKGIATGLNNIGLIYYIKGDLARAEKNSQKSMEIAQELGYPDEIKASADLLYKVYSQTHNYKNALANYELYIQMRDSINNEETQKATIKQNMQYEYEKQSLSDSLETAKELALKDIEIDKQQAEATAERTTKYGLFGGLGLVLAIAFVLARSVKLKKKANDEITLQKQEVEHKNKEILDSITYAERIQSAILPPMSLMTEKLGDGFVLYKPKDIVAGDFYWLETTFAENEEVIYFSAADCTGHGVPGAMMSVMCSNALTKSVKELGLTKPGDILDATTKIIEARFERSEQMVLDGMDLALCKLNLNTMKLEYAGANNPLWIIRNNEVLETKADKQPIGMYDDRKPYANHQIQLQTADVIYIFSDGFVDQFGGPKGKKFKSKPFKKMLLSIQNESMDRQKELIEVAFESWRGNMEQIDDVCVIGVGI